jgi:hypothetical protein
MTQYSGMIKQLRASLKEGRYADVLQIGRERIKQGIESSELLILMSTAGQLSEADICSLQEVKEWLELAIEIDPDNINAKVELGHFLDAVMDDHQPAMAMFESAVEGAIELLKSALDGLGSAVDETNGDEQEHLKALQRRALELLS